MAKRQDSTEKKGNRKTEGKKPFDSSTGYARHTRVTVPEGDEKKKKR